MRAHAHGRMHSNTRVSVLSICLTPSVREWLDANGHVWNCPSAWGRRMEVSHTGSGRDCRVYRVDSPGDRDKGEKLRSASGLHRRSSEILNLLSRSRCAYSPSPVKHTHSTGLTWLTAAQLPPSPPQRLLSIGPAAGCYDFAAAVCFLHLLFLWRCLLAYKADKHNYLLRRHSNACRGEKWAGLCCWR